MKYKFSHFFKQTNNFKRTCPFDIQGPSMNSMNYAKMAAKIPPLMQTLQHTV
jgi:hypothetical protein